MFTYGAVQTPQGVTSPTVPGMVGLHRDAWRAADTSELHIFDRLATIFRAVEPDQANEKAFGQDLRNVLMLAATAAEGAWKGVLKANGYATARILPQEQ